MWAPAPLVAPTPRLKVSLSSVPLATCVSALTQAPQLRATPWGGCWRTSVPAAWSGGLRRPAGAALHATQLTVAARLTRAAGPGTAGYGANRGLARGALPQPSYLPGYPAAPGALRPSQASVAGTRCCPLARGGLWLRLLQRLVSMRRRLRQAAWALARDGLVCLGTHRTRLTIRLMSATRACYKPAFPRF